MCLSSNEKTPALNSVPINEEKCDDVHRPTNMETTGALNQGAMTSAVKLLLWALFTYASKEFSIFLPVFQSKAGADTFIPASYQYDEDNTKFDNTILTYGTDYALCAIMLYAVYKCLTATTYNPTDTSMARKISQTPDDPYMSKSLRIKSACLFFIYAVSVFAGGYAHQTFTGGVDELNTLRFRIWWTVCVGTVSAAGGFMGACGGEMYKRLNLNGDPERVRFRFFYVNDLMWLVYGGYMTWICIQGNISYKRPACDIFVAGTTQFIPTVYMVLTALSIKWKRNDADPRLEGQDSSDGAVDRVHQNTIFVLVVGFLLNAPLLPTYPMYVQLTSLSLGVVNAIMHMNLAIAWSMQAISMCCFCEAFNCALPTATDKMKNE